MAVNGPKAPKDPEKKRDGFFILREKDIFGSPFEDGKGVCYIYEDDGRLIIAAQIAGMITDEEQLELLKTTEGFRKLVHSIGVTMESDNAESVRFVFQMYGKSDVYGSGTNVIGDIPADGMEHIIKMDDIDWSDDDKEPGQIRFEFTHEGEGAIASVRLYLNDGYTAPPIEEENPVDISSVEYKKMIEKSLMNTGNNYRLKTALEKAKSGQDTSIAFIGGSITQGAGASPINTLCYARLVYEGFCDIAGCKYDDNVKYVKAGVGGTPSELGMIRYQKDVLDECTPDVVIVEFAVNDEGDETKGECYDSLVRKIYNGPGKPAVILLFSVFADDFNLQERLKCVGEVYNLPMVSVKDSVVEQFYLKKETGRIVTKNQFFYDKYHPSNIGHRIMADGVINLMNIADKSDADSAQTDISNIVAPIGGDFEEVVRVDRVINEADAVIDCGAFSGCDTDIQYVERNMDLVLSAQFPDNWMYAPGQCEYKPFEMDVEGRIILLVFKDSAENRVGKADVYVDGKKTYYADPKVVGWTHCNAAIICREKESSKHHIEIRLSEENQDKEFTILGFGIVK